MQAALDLAPKNVLVRFRLAQAMARTGQPKEAMAIFQEVAQEALVVNAKSAPVQNLLGSALMGKSDSAQAEKAFRAAVDADRKYLPALLNLAQLALQRKNLDEAERQVRLDSAAQPRRPVFADRAHG